VLPNNQAFDRNLPLVVGPVGSPTNRKAPTVAGERQLGCYWLSALFLVSNSDFQRAAEAWIDDETGWRSCENWHRVHAGPRR